MIKPKLIYINFTQLSSAIKDSIERHAKITVSYSLKRTLMPLPLLLKITGQKERRILGINSGTSMDSIDLALVRVAGAGLSVKMKLEYYDEMEFPDGLKKHVFSVSNAGNARLISQLNFLLGKVFSDAVNAFIRKHRIHRKTIDLIGSHGQTVYHHPENESLFGQRVNSSLQLGDPSVIALETGILSVGDFRCADIAAGGTGAPLVPYFDYICFHHKKLNRGILNIGGIANITVLKKNTAVNSVLAFDTGPGNMMIDYFVQKYFGKAFDKDGAIAHSGKIHEALLNELLAHAYFKRPLPKSTGREVFGENYCREISNKFQLPKESWVATAAEFTARSIAGQYARFIKPHAVLDELIVSGGGAENSHLLERLRFHFKNIRVRLSSEFGIPAQAKEAMLFALLANETIMGNPSNIPNATGAKKKAILGKICLS